MALEPGKIPANLPRIIFKDNQISTPAFQLLELSEADLSGHEPMGVIKVRVGDFRLRKPKREVKKHEYVPAHAGENPAVTGTDMPNPPPHLGRRTLWDIDTEPLFDPGLNRPQRVMIRIVLANKLDYWPPEMLPAITAKDQASANALAKLVVDKQPTNGLPRATFWALRPKGASAVVHHSFNIAILAPDETEKDFTLPIIIDPSVRNRG